MTADEAYQRYFPLLRAKCRRMLRTHGEAEDIAQEAFVRLWQHGLGKFEAHGQVVNWLYRTSTRLAIDALRRRQIAEAALLETPVPPNVEALVEARRGVFAVARTVKPDTLQALILRRVDGLSQEEAASVIGCSERTLRRWLDAFDRGES